MLILPTFLFLLLCLSPIVLAERWGPWSERGGTLAHAASILSATRFTSHSRSTSFVTLSQCLLSDVLLSGLPVVGSHVVRSPTSLYTPHSVGITDSLSPQIFPVLFGLCYIIFSVIYVRGTGAVPNYTILTWTSSASIVYSLLGLFLILIW